MANPKQLEILKRGVAVWNRWRSDHPEVNIDLSEAKLAFADMKEVNFRYAQLEDAAFPQADLTGADCVYAKLDKANLREATLSSVDFSGASLTNANLRYADLTYATIRDAVLDDAVLEGAVLIGTNLIGTSLKNASFGSVVVSETTFANIDLRQVQGLERVQHIGPAEVGISTIYRSEGRIPEVFLRGCGVPEDFITYARSLVAKATWFYSCFISYSSADQEFAERLHAGLQDKGVRVWFAPHDLPIGAKIRPAIDESIRVHDKLLLVLSEASVGSQWVEQEVETALAREREQEGKTVLFPIRIDDALMEIKSGWPALLKNTRNVGDFTRWKDHDSYRKAFDRLLRDLRAGA